jgi:hypothetical protein
LTKAPGNPENSQGDSQTPRSPGKSQKDGQANEARGKHSKTRGRQPGRRGDLRIIRGVSLALEVFYRSLVFLAP